MIHTIKFISVSLLVLILSKLSLAQTDTINANGYNVFFHPNGAKRSTGYMVNGKPDGYWITYYPNGNKTSEGNRKNFMLDSTWNFYAANGDTTEVINYFQGKKNGLYKRYFTRLDSGINTVKSAELYLNDKKQGYCLYFYSNGNIHHKIKYKDNYKDGDGYEYAPDGTLIAIEQYRNNNLISRRAVNRYNQKGERTGTWVEVHPNGGIQTEVNYVNGLPNGTFKKYSKSGNIVQVKTYNNGLIVNQIDNPTIRDTLKVKNIDVKHEYYPNGTLKSIKTYQDSIPFGSHIYYDQNGEITKAEIFNKLGIKTSEGKLDTLSQKQGLWTSFFDDGNIESVGEYSDNEKINTWEFFYRNGNLRQKGAYKENFPDGLWTWYYDNGNILTEINYYIGEIRGIVYELDIKGDTIAKGNYTQDVRHGKWYFKIGDEYQEGNYYFGRKTGEWKTYYYPEMRLKSITNYSDGRKTGKYKEYYFNKKVKVTGKYENDNKSGKWTYYRNDGYLDYTAEYARGRLVKVNDIDIE